MPPKQLVDIPVGRCADDDRMPRHKPAGAAAQMNSIDLTITAAGMAEIDRIYESSGFPKSSYTPALLASRLLRVPTEFSVPEFLKSIGVEEAKRRIEEIAADESRSQAEEWIVGLYETARLDPWDIYRVNGGVLAVFSNIVPEVDGLTLDFEGQWRLLKGAP